MPEPEATVAQPEEKQPEATVAQPASTPGAAAKKKYKACRPVIVSGVAVWTGAQVDLTDAEAMPMVAAGQVAAVEK